MKSFAVLSVVTFQRTAHIHTKEKMKRRGRFSQFHSALNVYQVWHLSSVECCNISAHCPCLHKGKMKRRGHFSQFRSAVNVCKVWYLCNIECCAVSAYALPMFREGRPTSTRKQEEKVRKDPVKSHRPDLPVYGPGESPNSQQHCTSIGCILDKVHSVSLSRSFHLGPGRWYRSSQRRIPCMTGHHQTCLCFAHVRGLVRISSICNDNNYMCVLRQYRTCLWLQREVWFTSTVYVCTTSPPDLSVCCCNPHCVTHAVQSRHRRSCWGEGGHTVAVRCPVHRLTQTWPLREGPARGHPAPCEGGWGKPLLDRYRLRKVSVCWWLPTQNECVLIDATYTKWMCVNRHHLHRVSVC